MKLKDKRRLLFERLNRITNAEEVISFQIDTAKEMISLERDIARRTTNNEKLEFHIRCLRLYNDALVWWYLHPHAIRQLAKNKSNPKSLLGQGKSFDNVIDHAQNYYQQTKLPIIIADLTNIINIGDLVIVNNPEKPQIIECKTTVPAPESLLQGRIGRQVSRAIGTMEYLSKGKGKVFGQDYSFTIQSPHRSKRNWDTVEQLGLEALRSGQAYEEVEPGNHIWAARSELKLEVIQEIDQKAKMLGDCQMGTSLGLMNSYEGLFPPPSAWKPMCSEAKFEIIEGTVIVFHLVFFNAFKADCDGRQAIKIGRKGNPIVKIDDKEYSFGQRFVYDVVYGFETIQSCINGLILFARDIASANLNELPDIPKTKPRTWHVETLEDMHSLLKQDEISDFDYVSMPTQLARSLIMVASIIKGSKDSLAIMTIENLRMLANESKV